LREERRLRVYENRVLRRIFGPKKDQLTRVCKKLHKEELSDPILLTKYHSGNQMKKDEMERTCSTYGGDWRFILGFVGET
jgi:hypothetical protein